MLAAQLAQPPATNHTIVGRPRRESIVAVVPEGIVKVPLGASAPVAEPGGDPPGSMVGFVAVLPVPAKAWAPRPAAKAQRQRRRPATVRVGAASTLMRAPSRH